MDKFRFLKWEVYIESRRLVSSIVKLVRSLPNEYRFDFGNQLLRSCFSIPLNIAEGSGKSSDRELNRFLNIALGSVYETMAAVDILQDNKLISVKEFQSIQENLSSISNQLGGFKKKLKK